MATESENAVFESLDFDEEILSIEDWETDLEAELELHLSDLFVLKEEMEKIGDPDTLGKVILDEVWTQFANQIGLDMTSETLIQEYNREHPEEYSKAIGDAIMQDEKYKEANAAMKKQLEEGTLIDGYTGKTLGTHDNPNLDHVVPRKELYDNPRRKQAGIDTQDLANKEENLVPTNESLNKSKGKKSNQQYVNERAKREADLIKQAEAAHKKIEDSNKSEAEKRIEHEKIEKRLQDKLSADDTLMMEADARARKAINKDIRAGVTKQTAKKAGKDALKAMAVAALFDLLKSIMNGLVRFFKEKQKSFKSFLIEMKEAIKCFINHISSFVKTGATSAVGTVISEIFGPVVSMFKKLSSFIKQGVSSLVDAIRYLTAKENKNTPLSIKIAQVGKIVTTGLAAAGAIIGSEFIEKALLQIPVMAVEIPLLGSIANITGIFLASLLSGIVGAIVINHLDRYIAKHQKNDNRDAQIDKKNEILEVQGQLMDVKRKKHDVIRQEVVDDINGRHEEARTQLIDILESGFDPAVSETQDINNEELDRLLQE